jgi:hypothetical protein
MSEAEMKLRQRNLKMAMLRKLKEKLTRKDGKPVSFTVFSPLDVAKNGSGPVITDLIVKTLETYGNLTVKVTDQTLDALTLEELRKLIIHYKTDILIASSVKTTSFDIYLYDTRTPYYIYAYSEPIPPEVRIEVNAGALPSYGKTAMRKLLYRYLQNQFFEIPRSDASPVLKSEIPRWIASNESLSLMQRDISSNYYASISYGAALTRGVSSWTSNLLSLEVGTKIQPHLYLELALEAFSYNAAMLGLKYRFDNRTLPFEFDVGMSVAAVTNKLTIGFDPTAALSGGGLFMVPNASILLPLFDVYFKGEAKLYLGPNGSIYSLMPGFLVKF